MLLKSLSDYRDRRSASIWPWFRALRKGHGFRQELPSSDGPDVGRLPPAGPCFGKDIPSHNSSNQFAKIDLRFEEHPCPAASLRANLPELDARKAPVMLQRGKNRRALRTARTGGGARPSIVVVPKAR